MLVLPIIWKEESNNITGIYRAGLNIHGVEDLGKYMDMLKDFVWINHPF
jgi:hypothetical protein